MSPDLQIAFEVMKWPFVACLLFPPLLVYLGLHVVKREVIFVDLALAQVAKDLDLEAAPLSDRPDRLYRSRVRRRVDGVQLVRLQLVGELNRRRLSGRGQRPLVLRVV